jgi:hypothetical protein
MSWCALMLALVAVRKRCPAGGSRCSIVLALDAAIKLGEFLVAEHPASVTSADFLGQLKRCDQLLDML